MTKKTQAHQNRLAQLLDAAQLLFFKQGYEKTSVQNIIDAVKVAKGTFYHYFKSKDDLLNQLLDREIAKILPFIQKIVDDKTLNAIEKLNTIFKVSGIKKAENKEVILMITRALYDKSNLKMRYQQQKKTKAIIKSTYESIIAQGIAEKHFDTLPPVEAAELIINLQHVISETIVPLFLDAESDPTSIQKIETRYQSMEYAIERILGLPQNTIHLVNHELLELFLKETA